MKDTLISYSTAKLAHDKGFKIRCSNMFDRNKEIQTTPSIKQILSEGGTYKDIKTPIQIFAPTQSLLQKWIREVHKIHIVVGLDEDGYIVTLEEDCDDLEDREITEFDNFTVHNTYEEALEVGLYESLKLIKNE